MATTFVEYTGDGNATKQFTFPSYQESDVKVRVDGVLKTTSTHYNITSYTTTGGGNVVFTSGNIPASPANIRIYRDTSVDVAKATYTAGSSVKAADLNNNNTQLLYRAQEEQVPNLIQTYDINDDAITGAKLSNNLDIPDSNTIRFGNSQDLIIEHDSNHSYINEQGTGDLFVQSNGGAISFQKFGTTERLANFITDGSVELFHNGTKKLETTSAGATVTGTLTADLADDSINSEHYVDGSIDTQHIGDSQVTTAKIADSNVTTPKLAAGSVTTVKIADDNVTMAKLGNGALPTDITVASANLVNGTIQTIDIGTDQITNGLIADNQIDSEHYVDGSIDHQHLSNDCIDSDNIQDNAIKSDHYVDGSIDHVHLANDLIDGDNIQDNAVNSEHITDGSVNSSKLASPAVTTVKIVDNAVTATKLASSSVTTAKIAADAVTGAKIADDTLNSEHYAAGSIDTEHIADANITTAKIADSNVTTAKIADANVTTAKIANDAINGTKIADDSIDSEHYVDGSIDTAHIGNAQVTTDKIANANVTTDKLANTNVTEAKLANNAVSTRTILDNAVTADKIADAVIVTNSEQASHTVNDTTFFTTAAAEARYFNASTGETIKDGQTFPDNDTTIATTAAINDRIIDLVDEVGGFVAIANETSFPTANPDINNAAGTIVSVKAASTNLAPSGTTVTISNGAGTGNTVTITGVTATIPSGFGFLVETTSTLHTYTFHRLVPVATQVETVANNITNIVNAGSNTTNINTVAGISSNVTTVAGISGNVTTVANNNSNVTSVANNMANVNNFADRYQIAANNPSTDGGGNALAAGDLYFNTSANELKVYTGSAWQGGVTATGNFATVTGNTFTGDNRSNDNVKALFGTGSDLEIFHDGSNSRIVDSGTGELRVDSNIFRIRNAAGNESQAVFIENGACEFRFDNVTKLNTNAAGVRFIGHMRGIDGEKVQLGSSQDLELYHDSTNSRIHSPSHNLYVRAGGIFGVFNGDGSETMLKATQNAAVELYHDNGKRFETTQYGVTVTGSGTNPTTDSWETNTSIITSGSYGGGIAMVDGARGYVQYLHGAGEYWRLVNAALDTSPETSIRARANNTVELYYDNVKKFETTANGAQIAGNLAFADNGKASFGAGGDLQIFHNGSNSLINDLGTGGVIIAASKTNIMNSAAGENMAVFNDNGSVELYHDGTKKLETDSAGTIFLDDIFLGDNLKANFGASEDLQIYHTGSHSRILDNGTGKLQLGSATEVEILNGSFNESLAKFIPDGGVELYYDNSKKFETVSAGCKFAHDIEIQTSGTKGIIHTGYNIIDQRFDTSNYDTIQFKNGAGTVNYCRIGYQTAGGPPATSGILRLEGQGSLGEVVLLANGNSFNFNKDGHFTIGDNQYIKIGASQDLQIYHDGNHSYISDQGTGRLKLLTSYFNVTNTANNENIIEGLQDGAVNLYYDGSKKFETTSSGIAVTGVIEPTGNIKLGDNRFVYFGAGVSTDLYIGHEPSSSRHLFRSGDGATKMLFAGGAETMMVLQPQGAVELYYDNSKKLETTSTGINVTGKATFPDGNSNGITIGNSGDLRIFHNGSHSYVENVTGNLNLTSTSSVQLLVNNTENAVTCNVNGAVELYHNNSKKFETRSNGIQVTGYTYSDGVTIGNGTSQKYLAGDASQLQMYHTGNSGNGYLVNNTGTLHLGGGTVGFTNAAVNAFLIRAISGGAAELYYDNSRKFMTESTGTKSFGIIVPSANNTHDLGTTSLRWRNIYTNDLNLSNEGSSNDVDGTWGDWTIQEGESDLFLKNNRSGKKYKFNLMEVS